MIQIITDTTACLPREISERYHIPVIPQIITFGEESFYEGKDIDKDTFMRRLRNEPGLPKTAAPPPDLFVREFTKLASLKEPIICIHPSSDVSGTVRSATVASRDFPDLDIRVIDTRMIATPLGDMVHFAAEWAAQGESVDNIVLRLEQFIARSRIYFLVDTLEYLARGGRIGGAAALVGSVLQIKPILTFKDGKVDQYERERTHKRALARIKQIVLSQITLDGQSHISIMHADALEEAQILASELSRMSNQPDIRIADMPPAIVTHAGPGVIGVGFFTNS